MTSQEVKGPVGRYRHLGSERIDRKSIPNLELEAEMPPELSSFEIGRKVPRKPRPSGRSQGAQYDEATLPESPAL